MKSTWKKRLPLMVASFVGMLGTAHAEHYNTPSAQPRMNESSQMVQRPPTREITPDAGPKVVNGVDLFITADFIWWKTTQEGTHYAFTGIKTSATGGNAFTPANKGKSKEVGNDWSPGFKVGLGLNMNHDGWDIYAQYTWLRPSNSNSISNDQGVISQTFGISGSDGGPFVFGQSASARWDNDFNVIDLELGRNFYLSQFLTMRPFIGLKGTWQDQDYKLRFNSNEFELEDPSGGQNPQVSGPYRSNQHYDVWGIGVRGGFNIAWYMSKNWSIYGDLAFTALWSDYYNQRRIDKLDDSNTNTSTATVHLDNDDHYAVKYVSELELGLRWEMWFYDDSYHFSIQAGWEEQVWVNWNQFIEIVDDVWNDLSFHGLNLKFRFDF